MPDVEQMTETLLAAVDALINKRMADRLGAVPAGEKGAAGDAGPAGPRGESGRDAAQLDILAAIDATKGYARGTWARHDGGLVRAYRNTDPIGDGELDRAGWEVVVEGIKAIQIEQAGDRGFRVVTLCTSGAKSALECAMPVLLDRGRYSEAKDYEVADVVDWSGSMWKAEQPTKGVEPRPDRPEWRLLVRRGRDGKDAIVRTVEPQRVKV